MEVLLTGNTSFVTQSWVEMAFPKDHVLVTHVQGQPRQPKLKSILLDRKGLMDELVETYEFDQIVYFSEYLTPHSEQEGEMDRLWRVLQANREREVRLLYLTGPEGVLTPETGKAVMARASEALCRHYAQTGKLQIKVLHLPYLYGTESTSRDAGFARMFEQMQTGTVHFEEQAQDRVTALCMEDLAELVLRVFDTWTPEWETFTAPLAFSLDYEQLGEALKQLTSELRVTYGTDLPRAYPPDDGALRQRYGWFPRYRMLDDLPEMFGSWCERYQAKEKPAERLANAVQSHKRALRLAEILTAWVVTEGLVQMTGTQAQFRVVDFRLMFLVLVSTVYGLNAGVLAAALASVSLALGYWMQGASPLLLFYEPSNWLAFIVYFIVGAVCGYVQLRSAETVRFVQEESALLQERLQFVRRLYQDTLEDKRQFRRQILGRRDSFGKIYAVTQELNVLQPQQLYRKTVQVLESVLENQSVALYQLDENGHFARLAASSPGGTRALPRSVEVKTFLPVLRGIEQEGVWVNRDLIDELPMYGAAVRQEGRIVVLILLYEAAEDQLSLYYQNLFRILCGLVETALVRAFAYENAARAEHYLPGLRVLRPESFLQKLEAACALQEDKMAEHLLFRVHLEKRDRAALCRELETAIRSSDFAGLGPDGAVYLLLNQAGEAEISVVQTRLAQKGITTEVVPLEAQLEMTAEKRGGQP